MYDVNRGLGGESAFRGKVRSGLVFLGSAAKASKLLPDWK
jgi:hypothetical protein